MSRRKLGGTLVVTPDTGAPRTLPVAPCRATDDFEVIFAVQDAYGDGRDSWATWVVTFRPSKGAPIVWGGTVAVTSSGKTWEFTQRPEGL